MLSVRNLTKRFGTKKVVDGVTMKIQKQKITSFIGPNGAGKSTVLSMISRLILADEGIIHIDDKELSHVRAMIWQRRFRF